MRIFQRLLSLAACAAFALPLNCLEAQQSPQATPPAVPSAPIPPAVTRYKTVFISNAGADSGLFPHPFSGDTARPYNQFYAGLKPLGIYETVDDPAQADLILELQLTAPYGPSNSNKQHGTSDPLPMFRLVIYEQKTHFILWTLTESIDSAALQKTHDRNFDDAIAALLQDLKKLHSANKT